MIAAALISAPKRMATFNMIVNYISKAFPYYAKSENKFRLNTNINNTLSQHRAFHMTGLGADNRRHWEFKQGFVTSHLEGVRLPAIDKSWRFIGYYVEEPQPPPAAGKDAAVPEQPQTPADPEKGGQDSLITCLSKFGGCDISQTADVEAALTNPDVVPKLSYGFMIAMAILKAPR